ncbi:MAG: LamG domain-containing protein [Candidatus Pacebacteria bacterium]|nr:LamG domain-containing protein [Candidatus Paceibacterota bacterium]MDP6659478.1 LamG domain-containing protein [Candidatus Paceibacterota bacterium]
MNNNALIVVVIVLIAVAGWVAFFGGNSAVEEGVIDTEVVEDSAKEEPKEDNKVVTTPKTEEKKESEPKEEVKQEPKEEPKEEPIVETPAEEEEAEVVVPEPEPEPEPEPTPPAPEPEPEPEPEASNLVGHFKFNDGSGTNIADSSQNGNDGTLFNADFFFTWATGILGGALKFDNNDDYVSIPHSSSLNLGKEGESYTISFWFMRDGRPQTERLIVGKGPDNIISPFIIRIDQLGYPSFRISDGARAASVKVISNIGGDTGWHHIAAVRDASSDVIRLYLDGAEGEVASADPTIGSIENTDEIRINRTKVGASSFFSDPFFIDDLMINNVALSAAEIKNLFDTGKGL